MTNSDHIAALIPTLSDDDLDAAAILLRSIGSTLADREQSHRAELRINRGEGGSHEAAWYAPRSLPQCDRCGHAVHTDECRFGIVGNQCRCN